MSLWAWNLLETTQSPTESYRDITTPGIKDDNSPFPHLINGADLCRQPLAEWLKPSLNTDCRDRGNKGVQMGRERRRPPAARIPPSFPSVAFQHAAAATYWRPGNHSSTETVNKDLWGCAGVDCSTYFGDVISDNSSFRSALPHLL